MGFVVIWLITVLLRAFENLPQAEASRLYTHCIHGENKCIKIDYGLWCGVLKFLITKFVYIC
jgi:hypothetical protein